MEIISKLDKSQFNEVKELYADFFRSINFDNLYTDKMIDDFAKRKAKDAIRHHYLSQYYFAVVDNKIIGFIHGKIIDGIGLISHAYVMKKYRKQFVFGVLYRSLIKWFKDRDITIIEIEVNKQNSVLENIERNDWQMVRDFDDASVFIRKI